MNIWWTILLLTALYATIIAALIYVLRRWRSASKSAALLAFLLYGSASGILASWVWPFDSAIYLNLYGVMLGDWFYQLSTARAAPAAAAQAHELIPWLLRVPVVYTTASVILYGAAGLLLQLLFNHRGSSSGKPSADE